MASENKKELRQMVACQWLEDNYINHGHLRHDIVTDRLQIRVANLESLADLYWRNLTDKDINSMVCQCVEETQVNISTNEMFVALKSDLVPAVHPIRDWLNNLPPYTPDQPDWIDFVASQVKVNLHLRVRQIALKGCQNALLAVRPLRC